MGHINNEYHTELEGSNESGKDRGIADFDTGSSKAFKVAMK